MRQPAGVPLSQLALRQRRAEARTPESKSDFPTGVNCEIVEFWWELQASIAGWLWSEELLASEQHPGQVWDDRQYCESTWMASNLREGRLSGHDQIARVHH